MPGREGAHLLGNAGTGGMTEDAAPGLILLNPRLLQEATHLIAHLSLLEEEEVQAAAVTVDLEVRVPHLFLQEALSNPNEKKEQTHFLINSP